MAKMKTEFQLEEVKGPDFVWSNGVISIVGAAPDFIPYVTITIGHAGNYYVKDKDLERFAVNILKAIGSKKT